MTQFLINEIERKRKLRAYQPPERRRAGEAVREDVMKAAELGWWVFLDAGSGIVAKAERTHYAGWRSEFVKKAIAPGFGTEMSLVGIYLMDPRCMNAKQLAAIFRRAGHPQLDEEYLKTHNVLGCIPGDVGARLLQAFVEWLVEGVPIPEQVIEEASVLEPAEEIVEEVELG